MSGFMPSLTSMLQAESMDVANLLALRRDLERFRLLVEHAADVVIEMAQDGEVLYVGPKVRAVLGFWPRELVGRHILDWVHPDDLPAIRAESAPLRHLPVCRFRHQTGSWRELELSIRSFFTPEGDKRSVVIARDVAARDPRPGTEQSPGPPPEEPHPSASRPDGLGGSGAAIAHNLNNVLATIIACTDLARMDSQDLPKVQDHLLEVVRACDRATAVVRQMSHVPGRTAPSNARPEAPGCAHAKTISR